MSLLINQNTNSQLLLPNKKFAPTDLSGIRRWFDAGQGITKNGSNLVSFWNDSGGKVPACLVAQGDDTCKPLYVADAVNSKPALRFSSASAVDRMTGSAWNDPLYLVTVWAFTVCAVFKLADFTTTYPTLFTLQTNSGNWKLALSNNASFSDVFFGSSSADWGDFKFSMGITFLNTFVMMILTYNGAGATTIGNYTAHINGVSKALSSAGSIGSESGALSIGGNYESGYNGFNGDIAELIIYGEALSDVNRQMVERYFSAKYGITI